MKSLRNYQGWGIRALVVMVAFAWLALVAANWSEAAESEESDRAPAGIGSRRTPAEEPSAAPRSDDEYNFNWLDPDKKIYVLQNRRYLKANKLLLSAMVGPGFSNPYRTSYNIDPRLAYYFNESWGFEVFYTITMNSENGVFEALQKVTSSRPVIREIKSQIGAQLHWVPWYAKINVFNKILYFDWYFGAGAGSITADREPNPTGSERFVQENYFAGYLSTGHQYHLTNSMTVRLDFTGAFYQAPVSIAGDDKSWFPNYNFGIGVGFRL